MSTNRAYLQILRRIKNALASVVISWAAAGVRGGGGGDAHTDTEFIDLDSLTERAALAAILMRRIALGEPADQP